MNRKLFKTEKPLLWKGRPEKELTVSLRNTGGRNQHGRVTCRNKSGMGKRIRYRLIDFYRKKDEMSASVERIERDPIRHAFIALVKYENGEKSYVLAHEQMKAGDQIFSGAAAASEIGNTCLIKNLNPNTRVYNLELSPGKGAKIARAAGQFAETKGKQGEMIIVKLPSGEERLFNGNCRATVGIASNAAYIHTSIGSAGANRHRGKKPRSRGVAMNPVDHHNGGRTSGGKVLCSRTGNMKRGHKTRNMKKHSSKLIVKRRG